VTLVLFWDIDGTLLSTARAGVFALEQAAREVCGAQPDFERLETAGLTDWEVALLSIEAAGEDPAPETASSFLRTYERHLPERLHWRKGRVLPGVIAALEDLGRRPGVLNLLLTGNTRAGAGAKLSHYGLDGFFPDGGAFCEDGDDRPTIARRALELARARSDDSFDDDQTVVIGDTPHDVRCGRAIGARTLAVASGAYGMEELNRSGASLTVPELPRPQALAEMLRLPVAGARRG